MCVWVYIYIYICRITESYHRYRKPYLYIKAKSTYNLPRYIYIYIHTHIYIYIYIYICTCPYVRTCLRTKHRTALYAHTHMCIAHMRNRSMCTSLTLATINTVRRSVYLNLLFLDRTLEAAQRPAGPRPTGSRVHQNS